MTASTQTPGDRPRYVGLIENCSGPRIFGWVVDVESAMPPGLTFTVAGRKLGVVYPKTERVDMLYWYGRSRAGFDISFPPFKKGFPLFEGMPFELRTSDGTRIGLKDDAETFVGGQRLPDVDERIARMDELLASGHVFTMKYCALIEPFSWDAARTNRRIATLHRFVERFKAQVGAPLSLAYGTLLGAVRAGDVIGHDDDFDLIVISEAATLAELVVWQIDFIARLRRAGFICGQHKTAPQMIKFSFEDEHIDVFIAWLRPDGRLTSYHVDTPCRRDELFDFGEAFLQGFNFPAIRTPELFLHAAYGEGWAKPDPAFSWSPSKMSLDIQGIWQERLTRAIEAIDHRLYMPFEED